jgi:methylated-DNA-[protein]-cysteine S-methyltransferase
MSLLLYRWCQSPVGRLLLAGNAKSLKLVSFADGKRGVAPQREWAEDEEAFADVIEQLKQYFRGKLTEFDLHLEMEGTEFQKSVWKQLQKIPYGQTISYKQLAERVGNPQASRAVGAANGANPIPIIVPCHRVIGHDGGLTGFGGGLPFKKKLLELESRQLTLL